MESRNSSSRHSKRMIVATATALLVSALLCAPALADDLPTLRQGLWNFQRTVGGKKIETTKCTSPMEDMKKMNMKLEKSGCRALAIGFESLEPQYGLKKISSKGDHFLRYKEVVKKLHSRKIAILANFIFGFDNESESIFQKTFDFAQESRIDAAQFNILVPYPGTPLYERLGKEGRITTREWNRYISCNLCFKLKTMSSPTFMEELYRLKRKFYSGSNMAARTMRALARATPYEAGLLLAVNLGYRRFNRKLSKLFLKDS